jgi:WD40 repeat protein
MICHFAVFFKRPEPFKPVRLPRQQIVDFISAGRYFAKEPKYKPSTKSAEMKEPQWLTLDVQFDSSRGPMQVRWSDWNHVFPYSVEPLRNMAQGMALDAQVSDSLVQVVADSTDAIGVCAAEADLGDDCRRMLADLRAFLLEKLQGVLLVPGQGLHAGDSDLAFPNTVRHPLDTLTFGKKGGHYAIAISPDGKTIATVGDPANKAGLWDAETGELKKVLAGHKKVTRSVAFSPDGTTVATGSQDRSVIFWDVATGNARRVLLGHSGIVGALAFSPDGKLLASGGYDGTAILWRPGDGTKVASAQAHGLGVIGVRDGEKWHSSKGTPASVCSVAFSPDGRLLASGGTDGTVRVCAVDSARVVKTLEGYAESAWPVVFSPDGKVLAAGSYDRKVRFWEVATGKLVGAVEGHADYVFALAFSPDGKTLATGSSDTLVRVWDIGRKQRLQTFYGHLAAVNSVGFLPDGKQLASASDDGTVRVWPLVGIFREAPDEARIR